MPERISPTQRHALLVTAVAAFGATLAFTAVRVYQESQITTAEIITFMALFTVFYFLFKQLIIRFEIGKKK